MSNTAIPSVPLMKVEGPSSPQVKPEAADASSPEDDVYEDEGDLDFSNAQEQHWLSRMPKSLWEVLAKLPENGEIEIGTIRVEGELDDPKRVSLRLNQLPALQAQPKEYNLLSSRTEILRPKRPRNSFVFSEQDIPGSKRRALAPPIEGGSNFHNRSYLYEKNKRGNKKKDDKKDDKKRFETHIRKPVPKQTAIAGVVSREFECTPVENDEYHALENEKAEAMLKPKETVETTFDQLKDARYLAPGTQGLYGKSVSAKQEQKKKEAARENRAAKMEKWQLTDRILELFLYYRYWGLREIKKKVNQPDAFIRECLSGIATMWKSGDLNGKWELIEDYRPKDVTMMAEGTAPEQMESDGEGGDGDDGNEIFEDV